MGRETFKFWDVARLTLEVWRYLKVYDTAGDILGDVIITIEITRRYH